ncbi:MAG: UDP-3-O-(3-hydroxymyristoyl)glucosamine N-acyltransferase [Nitrospinota bacterium]
MMKTAEIADLLDGRLVGDPEIEINGAAQVDQARHGDITFLLDSKYVHKLEETGASAVVAQKELRAGICQILVPDPYISMARFLTHFYEPAPYPPGIDSTAVLGSNLTVESGVTIMANVTVEEGVFLGKGVTLYPGVFIGSGCNVGSGSVIYPNVTILKGVFIGKNVAVHSGSVIGSDGFGYHLLSTGKRLKIPQVGGVTIHDNVEIGANVCIDRGTMSNTIIKDGAKIDNLVQIAHNVTVGKNAVIAGQSGVAGSSVIGDGVMMGGSVGISDHVEIEDGTMLAANTGVSGNLKKGVYSGSPAIEHRLWRRAQAVFPKLPEIKKTIRELTGRVKALESRE